MVGKRLTVPEIPPETAEIAAFVGEDNWQRLLKLEVLLTAAFKLKRELRFPFGSQYGWGFKYSHGSKHLCYLFFEENGLTAMIQIGEEQYFQALNGRWSVYAETLWQQRYPCGKKGGGWLHYRLTNDRQLAEIRLLLQAKLGRCPAAD